ncbi:unnamed protein product, partial [marine sediment metagenome]
LALKDTFWHIDITINRLLAPQDDLYKRPFQYKKKGWGQVERIETITDGTPTTTREPKRKRRTRKGESEIKTGDAWSFREDNGHIILPWGSHYGLWKKTLLRSIIAQKRERYNTAPLALIKVYPLWLDVGKTPCESRKDKKLPERVLEKRHVAGKTNVMVEVFFDWIANRRVQFLMRVDGENPINDEKIIALIKTINTLDDIGPSRRGSVTVNVMKKIKLSEKEMRCLEKNELKDLEIPIGPVGTIA